MKKYHTVWEKEQEEEVPCGVGKEREEEVPYGVGKRAGR